MYLLFICGWTYWFGCGEIHFSGRLKGWALKLSTFLGPNGTRYHLRAQKCLDFQGTPLQTALVMDFPASKYTSRRARTSTLIAMETSFSPKSLWHLEAGFRIRIRIRIRINLSCWIRIRIQIADPDPGGQKWPQKIEKRTEFSSFEVLDVLFWGLKVSLGRPLWRPRDK